MIRFKAPLFLRKVENNEKKKKKWRKLGSFYEKLYKITSLEFLPSFKSNRHFKTKLWLIHGFQQ